MFTNKTDISYDSIIGNQSGCRYMVACCVFDVPPQGTPVNIHIYLILLETTIIGLHFADDNIGLSSLKFLWWDFISARVTFWLFKVIQDR